MFIGVLMSYTKIVALAIIIILITQQGLEVASISRWGGSPASFLSRNNCSLVHWRIYGVHSCNLHCVAVVVVMVAVVAA